MSKAILHRVTFLFLSVLLSQVMWCQQQVRVKASVDRDSILIGEPIVLHLEAEIPENAPIRFFAIDSIPHFEFLDRGKIDTVNTADGTILSRRMRITSFDSGHWVIPPLLLGDEVYSDSIPIDVGFSEFDRSQDYHDVKDIIDVEEEKKEKQWWWYLIGGGALVILFLIIYLMRRKAPRPVVVAPPVDPYKEAVDGLRKLKEGQMDRKAYYSGLTDIFRQYVYKRKGIHSLQKTTDDLVVQLKGIGMHKENFEGLAQALRLSDYVKFAKYIPDENDDSSAFLAISRAIDEIEQIK